MNLIKYPDANARPALLKRPVMNLSEIEPIVAPVLANIKLLGDEALQQYTAKFDGAQLTELEVTEAEFAEAEKEVSPALKLALATAAQNIERFHSAQKENFTPTETMPGVLCTRKSVGIQKVGLYIPGGTAPLFSTVLMLAIPARLAGCREIILCSPPNTAGSIHPAILYAARLAGVQRVFKAGGAQAIAAMAYGTQSIPKVFKIFGPGNQYVTAAKQLVNKEGVAIDMPAGPSEVMVVADVTADPAFVAADLLSQAEHGPDSQVILLTTDEAVALAVIAETEKQLAQLPRAAQATTALTHSKFIVLKSADELPDWINEYAPEHLILAIDKPEELAEKVVNAGSVFMGHYTPESVGDYASGTNHTLPTNGHAVAYSGVSLDSFVKKITFQQLTPAGLQNIGPTVEIMAEAEMLHAHKNAVTLRLQKINAL